MRSHLAAFGLMLSSAVFSEADSPPGYSPVAANEDGNIIARIEEMDFSAPPGSADEKVRISLFKYDSKEKRYALYRTIQHVGPSAPNLILLTRNAEFLVAFDSSGQVGRGESVVIAYTGEGKFLRKWSLEEILSKEDIESAPKSVSSTWWRREAYCFGTDQMIVRGPGEREYNVRASPYSYVLDLHTLAWRKVR
ncbi:hypothetical protein CMV30_08355 [Nibricoccus aquaticus]|uniref:Uncharacterized protein n=1 Tax=Nibricoccus aquaticus TaxID=2576891 RepID=A0A290Q9T5_9BACT|nr:hypothetical protein [Nibricoccus aquaticus]ATC63960.1 hypothetical protein CMV30_08355 [Nibricoccus aquaticus]